MGSPIADPGRSTESEDSRRRLAGEHRTAGAARRPHDRPRERADRRAGTHDDFLAVDGLYATLWEVQGGEIDAVPELFLETVAQE
nr:hypothetical protein [Natrinema versiforme]